MFELSCGHGNAADLEQGLRFLLPGKGEPREENGKRVLLDDTFTNKIKYIILISY